MLDIGLVDVPGHEDFVKNMVSGVGGVDAGLLVVAADDGWMPQTEEHFQILQYLGVDRLVIAVTKCDLADGEEAFLEEMIREELVGAGLDDIPVTPTSAVRKEGLEALAEAMIRTLDAAPVPGRGRPAWPWTAPSPPKAWAWWSRAPWRRGSSPPRTTWCSNPETTPPKFAPCSIITRR